MRKPQIILFDGTDGSGKTTSINIVEESLVNRGMKVARFSFPGYGIMGKVTRPFFIENSKTEYTKLLCILAEFAVFLEDYEAGKFNGTDYVLCDRFVLSTTHQYVVIPECIYLIQEFVTRYEINKYPYFLLVTDNQNCRNRLYERGSINEGDIKALAEADKTCFVTHANNAGVKDYLIKVDNNGTREELEQTLITKLDALLELLKK